MVKFNDPETYGMTEEEWDEYEQEYNDYLDEQESKLPRNWYDYED